MCSTIVVKKNAAGVEVRSYGVPTEEVLVTDLSPSNFPYATVLELSVSNILLYLEIDNSSRENILANRTVPITVRPPPSNDGWLVSMMVSTAAFPTGLVPTPNNFEMHLESMTKVCPAATRLWKTDGAQRTQFTQVETLNYSRMNAGFK